MRRDEAIAAVRDVVVIGGSLGSTAVLKRVLGAPRPDLPAVIPVDTHVLGNSSGFLAEVLASASPRPTGLDRPPLCHPP